MIKCKDNGVMTCVSKNGNAKSRWKTDTEAINNAKYLNEKYPSEQTKLVAYKCTNCHHYHLTTRPKRQRNR